MKKWELGYTALKPELVGESSASMHRTDKAPITVCHFRVTRLKSGGLVLTAWTRSTYGLGHNVSPYLSQKNKPQQTAHGVSNWRGEKKVKDAVEKN